MKIGIIGAGAIGGLIGRLWSEAGHDVFFSSRNPGKLERLLPGIKGKAHVGTVEEACAFANTILLAINYWTLDEAMAQMGNTNGKIIMDTTNPYAWASRGELYRVIPGHISGGEVLAQRLPGAKIVKVFSSMQAKMIAQKHHKKPGLVIFYTTDHQDVKPTIESLVADAGLQPVYYGTIADSLPIELFGKYSDKVLTLTEAEVMMKSPK